MHLEAVRTAAARARVRRGERPRVVACVLAALGLLATTGCSSRSSKPSSADAESPWEKSENEERRARLAAAMTRLEGSSGPERSDARWAFLDAASRLYATPRDVSLLPRFEALLSSQDGDDVALGIRLVGQVGASSSLPLLLKALAHPEPFAREQAMKTIAATYRDPRLVPHLREAIAHDEPTRQEAIRALRWFTQDPSVVALLHELLRGPKTVTLATEVLREARVPFDPALAVVAQRTYTNLGDGVSIDFPEDWPVETTGEYPVVFRQEPLEAFYGYQVFSLPAAGHRARKLQSVFERQAGLKNELAVALRTPPAALWRPTRAADAAEGRYTVEREGRAFVRRSVILVRGRREILIDGEAPREHAAELFEVFERMWPTLRIGEPAREVAAALQGAVDAAQTRAKVTSSAP